MLIFTSESYIIKKIGDNSVVDEISIIDEANVVYKSNIKTFQLKTAKSKDTI